MPLYYSDLVTVPVPRWHPFPAGKSRLLRERLAGCGRFASHDFVSAESPTEDEIARVHDGDYLWRLARGELHRAERKALGLPWSREAVERSRRSAGATLAAARTALRDGWAANLGGGSHHAFADRAEGFCFLNDVAIAAQALLAEGRIARIVVVDCDVHQGNGTAAIFAADDRVFTFSIHARDNFPFPKERSDLDIELPDGTCDDEYLWHLERGLDEALERSQPQLAFYVSGADPYEDDRLGRLALTKRGLARRDAHVLGVLRARGIPVALTMAGGYARDIEDSVAIHANTVLTAAAL
jgi:acetoin utilization deacetylase AcuC-like enzyme